ncbi:MAG: HAMP domain-containing histidine kinase [Treponema sp.]|nr:HAMP domain-containing histidine kinase [Treponema sp.]
MTIKRRLFISNILMIAVPVFASAAVGLICLQTVRFSLEHGIRPGLYTDEDFPETSKKLSLAVEHVLREPQNSWQKKISIMNDVFQEDRISYRIFLQETIVAQEGIIPAGYQKLLTAAGQLGEEALVSDGVSSLYTKKIINTNGTFRLEIYGIEGKTSYHALKILILCCAAVLILTIILSVWGTNRFLISFVFKRIEEPLDILSKGVHDLRDGNLSYRISYANNDEFAPVCAGFDDMAAHLKESVESVKQHEADRTELIAGISHDLRTPVTSIRAYVEGLLDGIAATPDMQQKYLITIRQKALELEYRISQLFLFSKMEFADFPVHTAVCSLAEEMHSIVQSCRDEYDKDSCIITGQFDEACVSVDRDLLMRVCQNIIGNSVKYKKKPVVHVHISITAEKENAVLVFTDDGPGVPPESLANLFTVFYRCDTARRNTAAGSGLGLAIAAKAVQRMGGTIMAENNKSGGLSIIIRFPFTAVSRSAEESV